MSAACPNFSHPAYVYSVDKLGADKTLEIYDAIGTTIIPKALVDAFVKQRDASEPVLVPDNTKRRAFVEGKDNNGIPFSLINNDRSWEVEKQTGLLREGKKGFKTVDGKAVPQYKTFSMRAATERIPKLMVEYPGFAFIPEDYQTADGRKTLRIAVSDPTFPVWAKSKPVIVEETPIQKYNRLTNYSNLDKVYREYRYNPENLFETDESKKTSTDRYETADLSELKEKIKGKAFYNPSTNTFINSSTLEKYIADLHEELEWKTGGGTHYFLEQFTYMESKGEIFNAGIKYTNKDYNILIEYDPKRTLRNTLSYTNNRPLLSEDKHFDGLAKGVKVLYDFVGNIDISIPELKFSGTAAEFLGVQQLREGVTEMPKEMMTTLPGVTTGLQEKINILKRAIPWDVEVQYSEAIEGIAELAPGGRIITINPKKMTTDAIGHEFGHIMIDVIGGMGNTLVKQGRDQLRGTKLEAMVLEKYPELAGDIRLDKEIVTTALGIEVAKIFDEQEKQTKFMRWLLRFFRRVRAALGIEASAVRQLAERLVAGDQLQPRSKATVQEIAKELFISAEASPYVQYSKDLIETVSIMDQLLVKEEELRLKALKLTTKKAFIYEKRDPESLEYRELKELIPKLERSSPTKSMIQLMRFAADSTWRMNNIYLSYLRDKEKETDRGESFGLKLDARLLGQWRTYVTAYDILNDLKNILVEARDSMDVIGTPADQNALTKLFVENKDLMIGLLGGGDVGAKKMKGMVASKANLFDVLIPKLETIITVKDKLKNLYKEKGHGIMVDWLAPHAGLVEGQYKEKWETEWRELPEEDQNKTPLHTYMANQHLKYSDQIKQETRDLIAIELTRASGDIGYMRRYADTILDSPDVISSAIAKIFFKIQEATRRETIDARHDFVSRIEALENIKKRPIGMSDEEYFDMFVENDPVTGERTDNIISEVPTKLVEDFLLYKSRTDSRHFRMDNGQKPKTMVDRWGLQKAWKDKYAPRRKEEWLQAQSDFVQSMLDDKMITVKEQARWEKNKKVTSWRSKLEPKEIFSNFDAVSAFAGFLARNNWAYRDVATEYQDINKKWKELERLRATGLRDGVQTDERVKFYDFLVEQSNRAESNLHISARVGTKIPSMRKEVGQKLRSKDTTGRSIAQIIKDEFKEMFQLQKYDVDRGQIEGDVEQGVAKGGRTELVNEANEPIYFIPTYYTNDVGETVYVLDDNFFKKLAYHKVPKEIIEKLKDIKGKSFETEAHLRDYIQLAKADARVSPLTIEESDQYIEYIIFSARKRDLSNKSFDLTSAYYNYLKMSIDYRNKFEILHEAEMAQFFVNNREVIRRDASGNIVMDAITTKVKNITGGAKENARVDSGNKSEIAYQLAAFYKMQLYGMKTTEEPDLNILGFRINQSRLLDGLSGYTALNLLGVNFVAGFANVALGEINQAIEAWAEEVFSAKDMVFATGKYYQNLGGILGDIGERRPTNIINLLNDEFDTINEFDSEGNLVQSRWYANMMRTNTLFFTSHAGEHYMQTRAMIAMLNHIPAYDAEGVAHGSIIDHYSVDKETHKLIFDKKGIIVNWDQDAKDNFSARMHRILSRMHGEYTAIGRSEMQQAALGRMAIMFRRFVIPGFKRRWEKKQFNNLYGDFTEGNYRVFGRFMKQLSKDLMKFNLELIQQDWKKLSTKDKANIIRTFGEIAAFLAAIGLASLALKAKENDDDDNWALKMATYQALRLRSELAFFISPKETLRIMRSPMASLSFAESLIDLSAQLIYPILSGTMNFEVYRTGSWKDHRKIAKTVTNMIPGLKQWFRVEDIGDQISWFN